MAHIHTDPGQHDLTASGFIIRADQNEPKLVLHRHKKLDKWMQFGGHVELHENPWQAVAHEILEESGYELSQLRLLQPNVPSVPTRPSDIIFHPWPLYIFSGPFPGIDHYHTDISFAFLADGAPKQKTSDGESLTLKLFSRKEIEALGEIDTLPNLREVALFVFDECLPNWKPMPATDWR